MGRRIRIGAGSLMAAITVFQPACSSAPPAAHPSLPLSNGTAEKQELLAGKTEGAHRIDAVVPETPESMPLTAYRTELVRRLTQLTRTRELISAPPYEPSVAKVPHSVLVLKKIGQAESYVVATAGFGRLSPTHRIGDHIELLAYVEQFGPNISKILSALGSMMHARDPQAPAWKAYDTVQLPTPEFGLQYFDLRSAGEIDLAPDVTVTLLKVIPISAAEYEKSQDNASSGYDDPNTNARMYQRWRQALEKHR